MRLDIRISTRNQLRFATDKKVVVFKLENDVEWRKDTRENTRLMRGKIFDLATMS